MSAKATAYVWEHSPYRGVKKLIHLAIADVSNDDNGNRLWMSQTTIADKSGCDRKTVNRALTSMVEDGYLELVEGHSGDGRPNVYSFLMPPVTESHTPVPESPTPPVPESHTGCTTESQGVYQNVPGGVPESPTNTIELKRTQEELNNEAAFLRFWMRYPRKVGRPKAEAAFISAVTTKKVDAERIIDGLEAWKKVWKRDGTQLKFIPHPTTWLNREGWDDAIPPAESGELKGNAQLGKDFLPFEYDDGADLVRKLGAKVYE